jgi:hypothetical protein
LPSTSSTLFWYSSKQTKGEISLFDSLSFFFLVAQEVDPEKRLGVEEEGFEKLKKHPFFASIGDWNTLHLRQPPQPQVLVQKLPPKEPQLPKPETEEPASPSPQPSSESTETVKEGPEFLQKV